MKSKSIQTEHSTNGTPAAPAIRRITVPVEGMDCADCARTVEQGLVNISGVKSASVNLINARADIAYDPAQTGRNAFVSRIEELGYSVPQQSADGSGSLRFRIEGMDCGDCARTVEKLVANLPGVEAAQVNFGAALLEVHGSGIRAGSIEGAVESAGFRAAPLGGTSAPQKRRFTLHQILTLAGTLLLAAGYLAIVLGAPHLVSTALFAAAIATGFPTARAALAALRVRRIDMNVLMTLAVVGAAVLGAWEEGAMTYVLYMIGTTLQAATIDRARQAIGALAKLVPDQATVLRGDREERVPLDSIAAGELVRIRPGERIGVDGFVERGRSSLNQAAVTGESIPVAAEPGSRVFAGSINGNGALEVRVSTPASDNTLARISAMVESAQAQRAPAQEFVDRFAARYTPLVVAGAALVATVPPLLFAQPFTDWFYRALVLLVIACPCALVIATPVAVVSALGNATRRGVLLRGGVALERLASLKALAFDKTGTLTRSRLTVTDILPVDGSSEEEVLALAAALEQSSEHPIGRTIVAAARERNLALAAVEDFQMQPGQGVRGSLGGKRYLLGGPRMMGEERILLHKAQPLMKPLTVQGKMVLLLAADRKPIAVFGLADLMRHNTPEVIQQLKQSGIRHIALLSGDSPAVAGAIAEAARVDEMRAGLLPADKVTALQELKARWHEVGMVGDGVNDAPALAAATTGIAMGMSGTDVALETADIVLMGDDLSKLPWAIRLARSTTALMRQNITIALVSKAVFLVLGAAGIANLWVAVFADMGVSLLVTLNALRLMRK